MTVQIKNHPPRKITYLVIYMLPITCTQVDLNPEAICRIIHGIILQLTDSGAIQIQLQSTNVMHRWTCLSLFPSTHGFGLPLTNFSTPYFSPIQKEWKYIRFFFFKKEEYSYRRKK